MTTCIKRITAVFACITSICLLLNRQSIANLLLSKLSLSGLLCHRLFLVRPSLSKPFLSRPFLSQPSLLGLTRWDFAHCNRHEAFEVATAVATAQLRTGNILSLTTTHTSLMKAFAMILTGLTSTSFEVCIFCKVCRRLGGRSGRRLS